MPEIESTSYERCFVHNGFNAFEEKNFTEAQIPSFLHIVQKNGKGRVLGLELLSVFLLAFAVSIDGLAAGLSLGLRGIHVRLFPLVIISCISALAIFFAMALGRLITQYISLQLAHLLGASILFFLGGLLLKKNLFPKRKGKVFHIRLALLGIIIEIRKEPLRADLDSSGGIEGREAYLLGFALAMDAVGVGLGASLIGLNLLLIPLLVGLEKFLLLLLGARVGMRYGEFLGQGVKEVIPGCILILLGLMQCISFFRG